MSRRKLLLSISSCIFCTAVAFTLVTATKSVKHIASFATYTNGDGATYYNGIGDTLAGNDLLKELQALNKNKRKSTVGYDSMGTSISKSQYKYTDYDPSSVKYDSNNQPYGTKISSFYTYTPATSWNREHVWPNSHGGGSNGGLDAPYVDADIHMTRPTIAAENSSRGNSYYVEGLCSDSAGWDPKAAGYDEKSRGEAARIIMYCVVADARLDLECTNSGSSKNSKMGNLETLLKWNLQYPVTQREKNRNEGAEYLQGNRNPFIDHPEYGCKIWGGRNASTQAICGGQAEDKHGTVPQDPFTVSEAIEEAKKYNSTTSGTYYTKGIISGIKNYSADHGNAEFWISQDGTSSTPKLLIYRGLYKNGQKITSQDQIKVGTKVIISGQLTNYMGNTPEYVQGSFIYAVGSEVDEIAPDPTPTPTPSDAPTPTPSPTPEVLLESISVTKMPDKVEFEVGDEFTYEGLEITAKYSDNSEKSVEPTNVETPDMTTAGSKRVKVEYEENGKKVVTRYSIQINEKTITPTPTPTPSEEPTEEPTEKPTSSPEITPTPSEEPTAEPTSPEVTPTVEPTPTPKPQPSKKGGCNGSIVASSVIISITSLLGVALLLIKKKH